VSSASDQRRQFVSVLLEKPFINDVDIVLTIRGAIRSYFQERDLIRQNEELKRMNAELVESTVQARTKEPQEKNRELEVLSVTDRSTIRSTGASSTRS
jgi:hypothetical protein